VYEISVTEKDFIFVITSGEELQGSAKEAARWYLGFLRGRFRLCWNSLIDPSLKHLSGYDNISKDLTDEIVALISVQNEQIVFKFLTYVARNLITQEKFALDAIVEVLYNEDLLKEQVNGDRIIPEQLLFSSLGWLSKMKLCL
jgi:hypothetical protein